VVVVIDNLRVLLVALAACALILVGFVVTRPEPSSPMRSVIQPEPHVIELPISPADDEGKPGTLRSVMGQRVQYQEPRTSGPSGDRLHFVFDAPARVVGVTISVDLHGGLNLAEWAIGINAPVPYGLVEAGTGDHREFTARDWLLHVSHAAEGRSQLDEQAWFGEGFEVEAGDAVTVDAWLVNPTTTRQGASPEVIVYYEWLPATR
jgi:hypothetical protein